MSKPTHPALETLKNIAQTTVEELGSTRTDIARHATIRAAQKAIPALEALLAERDSQAENLSTAIKTIVDLTAERDTHKRRAELHCSGLEETQDVLADCQAALKTCEGERGLHWERAAKWKAERDELLAALKVARLYVANLEEGAREDPDPDLVLAGRIHKHVVMVDEAIAKAIAKAEKS